MRGGGHPPGGGGGRRSTVARVAIGELSSPAHRVAYTVNASQISLSLLEP